MIIKSKNIYTKDGIVDGYLIVNNGKIEKIEVNISDCKVDFDYGENNIIPGIIDTHNHGTMGFALMGDISDKESEVRGYLKGLASQGVTSCLPTADIELFSTIVKLSKEEIDGARPIGIHSEGPYLNRVGEKGIDTGHPDIDINVCKKMIDDAEGLLKLVAIAPEIVGAKEAIELFNKHGVKCSFAHSNMMYEEAKESFKWGISVSTHTANVMTGIHHRNMGGLGACLLNDEIFNELIADGLHVSNEMIEIMMRTKNNAYEKFLLVSDNVPMAGAPIGRYQLGEMFEVNIDERGYCLSDTGRLCGSTLPVIMGIKNLVKNMNIPLEKVIRMASLNPAKVYNADTKGEISEGKDADFVVIDDDFNILTTYCEGRCIYQRDKDTNIFNQKFIDRCAIL